MWPVLRWATAWTRWISASPISCPCAASRSGATWKLPAAPNLHYSALADGGYAIFLNRGDFLGAAELLAPHMTLGLAYPGTAAQFLGSGNVDPAWMEGLEDRVPVTEERAGAVVALTPSSKFSSSPWRPCPSMPICTTWR